MKILHFTRHCINRILYNDLACCRSDKCDFSKVSLYSQLYKVSAFTIYL